MGSPPPVDGGGCTACFPLPVRPGIGTRLPCAWRLVHRIAAFLEPGAWARARSHPGLCARESAGYCFRHQVLPGHARCGRSGTGDGSCARGRLACVCAGGAGRDRSAAGLTGDHAGRRARTPGRTAAQRQARLSLEADRECLCDRPRQAPTLRPALGESLLRAAGRICSPGVWLLFRRGCDRAARSQRHRGEIDGRDRRERDGGFLSGWLPF